VITICLAGTPTGKGRPRFVRVTGRAYTPAKTRDYEDNLRYAAQVAMGGRAPLDVPLDVTVTATFPIPESWSQKKKRSALLYEIRPTTKPDADNLLKVLDALNQVAFVDDKQIVRATIEKFYGLAPRLEIVIRPIELA